MANDTRGEVAIELGGRDFKLRVRMSDLKKLKAELGMPVHGYLAKHGSDLDPEALSTIFTYALKDMDGAMVDQNYIDEHLDASNLVACLEKLLEAFGMGKTEIEKAKAKAGGGATTGADPTPSPTGES